MPSLSNLNKSHRDIIRDELNKELNKTENTKYSTVNGIKEFSCKDGYVDNVVIEGQTKILNSSNQEVQAGTTEAKLVSVGQEDKIEILTTPPIHNDLIPQNYTKGEGILNIQDYARELKLYIMMQIKMLFFITKAF